MSMIGYFRMSWDLEVQGLLAQPDKIESLIYPESDEQPEGLWEMDVDKAWHAIHFLLCGDVTEGEHPLNFVISGGTPVGDIDVGYGPARVYTSVEVAEIAEALAPITSEQLRVKFDAKAFVANDIYPGIWDEPIEECLDGYVLSYFEDLKAFVLKADEDKRSLIVHMG